MAELLHSLATGDLTASEAHSALETFHQGDGHLGIAYNAFVSWIWQSLSARRSDDELREWHGLMQDLAFRADNAGEAGIAERMHALTDVLTLAIRASDRPNATEVLKRAHVPALLRILAKEVSHPMPRSSLLSQSGLQSANLSRLLSLLVTAGLVDRSQSGKEAQFALTAQGIKAAASLPATKKHRKPRLRVTPTSGKQKTGWRDLEVRMSISGRKRKPEAGSDKVVLVPNAVQVAKIPTAAFKHVPRGEPPYLETPNAPRILCAVPDPSEKAAGLLGVRHTQYHYEQPETEYHPIVQDLQKTGSSLDE